MIIGVTGSLATGKSSLAGYLRDYLKGYLIDADRLSHLTLSKNGPACKRIVSFFGKEILDKRGTIDRTKLAERAFSNKSNLKKLCGIIHPLVIKDIRRRVKKISDRPGRAFIIVDGPVLIESGFHKNCDYLVVVISPLSKQLERAGRYKKLALQDALSRIRLQMPLSKKAEYADYIIDNSASLKELRRKTKELAGKIKLEETNIK